MIFTAEERKLFNLYCSGSVKDTVLVVLEALLYIDDLHERTAAKNLLWKLRNISEDKFIYFVEEREVFYG